MTTEEQDQKLVEWTTKRVLEELAGAGLGADPDESLLAVVDRLIERDGADQVAESLRELANEIAEQEEDDANSDA